MFFSSIIIQSDGTRANDGIALPNNRYFVIPLYDFHTWSKTNCG